jgi:ABC-type uncharacterized transport system auxiliary subunit
MKQVLIVLLLLGGCAVGARNSPPLAVYDFGLPAARLPAAENWPRVALEVRSPAWFDSLNIDYRLAYDNPLKQREYADSRWAGAPGVLLAQRLRQQLGTVNDNGSSACLLRVELQEFSQVFASPQQSQALIQANVQLFDARRQLLVVRQLTVERPASSGAAAGGVAALVDASNDFGVQLARWLASVDAARQACR